MTEEQAAIVERVRATMKRIGSSSNRNGGRVARGKSGRKMRRAADGHMHAIVVLDGVECWACTVTSTCAGCSTSLQPEVRDRNGVVLGSGCNECRGRGKRRLTYWLPFDVTA